VKLNGAAVVIIKLIPSTKTFNRGRGEKEREGSRSLAAMAKVSVFLYLFPSRRLRVKGKIGRSGENHGMRHTAMRSFEIVAEMRFERYVIASQNTK
jgi:hypothetical protein